VEQATDAHIKRYHERRSAEERAALKAKIAEQVQAMALIRDLELAFESAAIAPDFAAAQVNKPGASRIGMRRIRSNTT
jgi:hypothetical protein